MKEIYRIIDRNNWIGNYRVDPSWAKLIFLLMWYTRRTIYIHQDPKGNLKFIDNIKRYEFLKKAIDNTLPMKFIILDRHNVSIFNCAHNKLSNSNNGMQTQLHGYLTYMHGYCIHTFSINYHMVQIDIILS